MNHVAEGGGMTVAEYYDYLDRIEPEEPVPPQFTCDKCLMPEPDLIFREGIAYCPDCFNRQFKTKK